MRSRFYKGTLNDLEREIVANVDKHGCHINAVFDPDGNDPSFAYSVGFTKTLAKLNKVDVPEVIAFGLPDEVYGPAFNTLLAMCAADLDLVEGERIPGFFGDYDCIVRAVHGSWIEDAYLASAIWYHRTQMNRELTNVVMLTWPDADHLFPWEDGCADWVRSVQPPLYEPRLNS